MQHNSQPTTTYLTIQQWIYNLIALFAGCCSVVAGLLLVEPEATPFVRIAFAISSFLFVTMGKQGGLFHGIAYGMKIFFAWCASRKLSGSILPLILIALIFSVVYPVFVQARNMSRASTAISPLKRNNLALAQYLQEYDDTLPPRTDARSINISLSRSGHPLQMETRPGKLILWREDIGGLCLHDIESPESIIVAYSQETYGGHGNAVLFLNGSVKLMQLMPEEKFTRLMQKQTILIIEARRAKANRLARSSQKKHPK